MAIIGVVGSKGGVGKTTTSLLTALGLAKRGRRVLLIDADRNAPLKRWTALGQVPEGVFVTSAPTPLELLGMMEGVRGDLRERRFTDVVIDTACGHQWTPLCVRTADLVLTPLTASPLDIWEALQTVQRVRDHAVRRRRPLGCAGVLCRAPAAVRTRSLAMAVEQLRAADIPMVSTPLLEKEAYRALFAFGGGLETLDPRRVAGLEVAKRNAAAFAADVAELAGIGVRQPAAA